MMSKYHISKILNNNVIICINSNQEVILIGKGIGFNKKPGMVVDDNASIEKVYKLDQKQQQEYYKSLVEISLINKMISKCVLIIENDIGYPVNPRTVQYQRFIRHIQFLIRRLNKKEYVHAQDEFINMVKTYYPNCYSTAYKISKVIQKDLDIDIDDSEIVYLALHIYHFQSQNNTQNE